MGGYSGWSYELIAFNSYNKLVIWFIFFRISFLLFEVKKN
jgi:hypothetical protein